MNDTGSGKGEFPGLILFDWDGTIVDSYGFLKAAHNHVRERFGFLPWSDADFKTILRHSTREIYGQLYGNREDEATATLRRYVDENHRDSLHLMDGADELVTYLRENGTNTGVVSNKRHERLAADVASLGWDTVFKTVVGAGKAQRDKPAADPLSLAVEESGYEGPISRVWYVGDTITDMECAAASGVTAVFVEHGMGDFKDVSHLKPRYVFQNLTDLTAFLRKYDSKSD